MRSTVVLFAVLAVALFAVTVFADDAAEENTNKGDDKPAVAEKKDDNDADPKPVKDEKTGDEFEKVIVKKNKDVDAEAGGDAGAGAETEKPKRKRAAPKQQQQAEGGDEVAPANVEKKRRPRSLMQACKKESKKLCKEGSMIAKCLQENLDQIEDDVCKSWVTSRQACLKDAETSSKCEKKESPRACLRKLGAKDVSEDCGESDFFKAVQMYTRWRRRHESGPFKKNEKTLKEKKEEA